MPPPVAAGIDRAAGGDEELADEGLVSGEDDVHEMDGSFLVDGYFLF